MPANAIRIGMIGCGTVGSGTLALLESNKKQIQARLGYPIEVKSIAVRNTKRERALNVPADLLTTKPESLVNDENIDVIVEVMGGVEPARSLIRTAISKGKSVITANKALLAEAGDELFNLAREHKVDLYYEAAVAGGVPVIRTLRESLATDEITEIRAILNGTSNYILTRMNEDGLSFAAALKEAQKSGYAEANASLDVDGVDAQHKIAILARVAFGAPFALKDIATEGIASISALDMKFAKRFGYTIKPLAIARVLNGRALDVRVHPALIHQKDPLSHIHRALNAIDIRATNIGSCLLSGPGAGGHATAVSIVADIIDVSRNLKTKSSGRVPPDGFAKEHRSFDSLQPVSSLEHRYYLRFVVHDEPGVLAMIAKALGDAGVSIEHMVQEGEDESAANSESATIVILTHVALEANTLRALAEISKLSCIRAPSLMLRIEPH